jgi:hypothetical protein
MLQDWLTYFPRSDNLYSIVDSSLFYDLNPSKDPKKCDTADYHCSSIPRFIRNVHSDYAKYEKTMMHQEIEKLLNDKFLDDYAKYEKTMMHQEIEKLLNDKFPAVCSKNLDAILRCFNEEVEPFRFKLATQLESKPYDFGPRHGNEL